MSRRVFTAPSVCAPSTHAPAERLRHVLEAGVKENARRIAAMTFPSVANVGVGGGEGTGDSDGGANDAGANDGGANDGGANGGKAVLKRKTETELERLEKAQKAIEVATKKAEAVTKKAEAAVESARKAAAAVESAKQKAEAAEESAKKRAKAAEAKAEAAEAAEAKAKDKAVKAAKAAAEAAEKAAERAEKKAEKKAQNDIDATNKLVKECGFINKRIQNLREEMETVGTRAKKLSDSIDKCNGEKDFQLYKDLIGELEKFASESQKRLVEIMKKLEKLDIQELDEGNSLDESMNESMNDVQGLDEEDGVQALDRSAGGGGDGGDGGDGGAESSAGN